ncbi:hypothetical protein M9H77_29556 [Catharanthus roseus]|uniref:Uncharacterized protein n=1 Tax=Catharanthus roseus TaxID=4058 RepID=A0ACB9ZVI8_CATRO|nr:hypothetical protein M9H77_29556 [Catharanthus roseus]
MEAVRDRLDSGAKNTNPVMVVFITNSGCGLKHWKPSGKEVKMMKGNENRRKQRENDENGAVGNDTANLPHEVHCPTVAESKNQFQDFDLQLGDSKDELGIHSGLQLRLQFQS